MSFHDTRNKGNRSSKKDSRVRRSTSGNSFPDNFPEEETTIVRSRSQRSGTITGETELHVYFQDGRSRVWKLAGNFHYKVVQVDKNSDTKTYNVDFSTNYFSYLDVLIFEEGAVHAKIQQSDNYCFGPERVNFQIAHIEELNFSANMLLKGLPPARALYSMKFLRVLILAGNLIEDLQCDSLEALSKMKTLEVLDLSGNRLSRFPIGLCKVHSLTEIDISYNNMKGSIPPAICNIPKLTNLILKGNHIDLQEMVEKSDSISFLRRLFDDQNGNFAQTMHVQNSGVSCEQEINVLPGAICIVMSHVLML